MSNEVKNGFSWYLWKRAVDSIDVRFLHYSELPNCGFRSVYAVDEQTATALQRSANYTGFKGVVWNDKLWIDCDTHEGSNAIENGLRELGLGFERWTTGNRGSHFGINRNAEPSQLLPAQDRAWVKIHFPQADLSLYSHLHLFRCPGEIHSKTGVVKHLVLVQEGAFIEHTSLRQDSSSSLIDAYELPSNDSIFTNEFLMNWSVPQVDGNRHKAIVSIATVFANRGEDSRIAMWWIQNVNLLFKEPKSDAEIERAVEWAYENHDRSKKNS